MIYTNLGMVTHAAENKKYTYHTIQSIYTCFIL